MENIIIVIALMIIGGSVVVIRGRELWLVSRCEKCTGYHSDHQTTRCGRCKYKRGIQMINAMSRKQFLNQNSFKPKANRGRR